MSAHACIRVAILYAGDLEARRNPAIEKGRFAKVFQALTALGIQPEPAVYHDDYCADVRRQIMEVDGVFV